MCWETWKKGSLRFAYYPERSAKKVFLAGSFNNWKPVSMPKQKSGEFVRILKLPPGTYEYKFVVDGTWKHDSDQDNHILNSFGSLNSLVVVE